MTFPWKAELEVVVRTADVLSATEATTNSSPEPAGLKTISPSFNSLVNEVPNPVNAVELPVN